ncbi:MAG: carboxyltransferase domain-containing protein [Actinomycetota bacterium]
MSTGLRWRPIGDSGVLVDFPSLDPEAAWRRVVALDRAAVAGDGVLESCPALVNLLVRFDPLVTDHESVGRLLESLEADDGTDLVAAEHVIGITYDGLDLAGVAAATGLDVDQVSAAHAGASFRVRMYGFAPGYAYLDGLPEVLRLPRKPTAVRDVPAGSVIIANDQCIVTTLTMPTGWWVIGRSSTPILTPRSARPARFAVGDVVRFREAS